MTSDMAKAPTALAGGGASDKVVCSAARDNSEITAHLTFIQAETNARRFGLRADRAGLIAELAFTRSAPWNGGAH